MADGRDMSGLFAAVVKNVVSKNVEVSGLCNVLLKVFPRDRCKHVHSLSDRVYRHLEFENQNSWS